jgi:uncharacterized membrane protein
VGSGDAAANLPLVIGLVLVILALVGVFLYRSGMLDTDVAAAEQSADVPDESAPATGGQEILSDTDKVTQLLEENGGRMKQVRIVEETEWSKSKVSMLLSDMDEAGTINKLRVGRENIISLEGEEPDAAGSPFPDEE